MSTYAIMPTTRTGHPLWINIGFAFIASAEANTPHPGQARKFNVAADAAAWLHSHRRDPEYHAIVEILPGLLEQAEARAQHEWNHRDCRNNGRAA